MRNQKRAAVLAFACALLSAAPAAAITTTDVNERMDSAEGSAFIAGAVDMYSHMAARNGDRQRADCAVEWYFRTDGAVAEVFGVFENTPDRDAVAVIEVLINRHCGGD